MTDLLIRKLEQRDALSDVEKRVLQSGFVRTRDFGADEDIVREGDRPGESCVILEGFAARYKLLGSGRRQITAIHVPGDFVDLHSFLLKTMDHGIVALSPCRMTYIPHATLKTITEEHPHLTRMLWLSTLINSAIHRQWLAAMGRTSAASHMALLICELHCRLHTIGLAEGGSFRCPVTQDELGDALGLSTVHVNRVLTELRNSGLVSWQHGTVTILDKERLYDMAEFSPLYLNLESEPR